MQAPRGTLAVVLFIFAVAFAVLAIIHSATASAAHGCTQLSKSLLTCAEDATPPEELGACAPYRTPGNLTVWTCSQVKPPERSHSPRDVIATGSLVGTSP